MSNKQCCVPGCLNSLDTNANLHKFPNLDKEKELFNKWVYSVGGDILQLGNDHIFKYRRVCQVHFEQKYYCRSNRLTKDAVPTRDMPGLSVLKFHSVSGVLRPLQISEASTSKEPVTSHLDSVDMQAHTQRAVEEMQIKENLDPITTHRCTTVSRDYVPMHATAAVEDVQINQNLEHRKKQQQTVATRRRVKRVALSQSEHVLYKKLMLVGVKLNKGILPAETINTADILLFFDKLFDSMNGSFGKRKKHGKPLLGPATPTSIHHKTWKECKVMMKDMRFINNKTSNDEYVPTINNWVWTLERFELLLKKIESKYGVTSVWLRHLNQDPIENFFGSIRSHGCRNVNPTPERFESAFTTLLVNSLSSVHAPGANCESDNCETLHEVLITSGGIKEQTNCELSNIPDITFTPLEEKNDPRVIGGLQYVSGYFVKTAKKKYLRCVLNVKII
ncbi:hypothetical protein PYW07_005711 [Mythimna separata]|uniref:THAP-type domain-containing protein n=1 Tax=Mythimna separata TaxID=271217 RepID=A0AAD8DRJ4_MYTSE|nr:hypothetical protein PYW07_005711 [Mythimna separata]